MNLRLIDDILFRVVASLLLMLALIVAALAWNGPAIVAGMAEQIVGHSGQPTGTVYPPTPFLPLQSTAEMAALGGRAEGISCSLPRLAESFFADAPEGAEQAASTASVNLQFRQACFRHDYCYRHGAATYGYTQLECDNFLAEDAARLCKQIMRDRNDKADSQAGLKWCQTRARKVLLGVMLGGAAAFREQRPNHRYQVKDQKLYDLQSEVSTRLEYDPYANVKSDGQQFSLRLAESMGRCGGDPALITFRRQISGQWLSYRCINYSAGNAFSFAQTTPISHPLTVSEFGHVPGAPWLVATGNKQGPFAQASFALVQWCRDFDDAGGKTGGFFAQSDLGGTTDFDTYPIWFRQCNLHNSPPLQQANVGGNTIPANSATPAKEDEKKSPPSVEEHIKAKIVDNATLVKRAIEPDTTAYFPLPNEPAFGVNALFLNTSAEAGIRECHAWAVPNTALNSRFDAIIAKRTEKHQVTIAKRSDSIQFPNYYALVERDPDAAKEQGVDCYRWFTAAPQFVTMPGKTAMKMLFFRRGDADGADYATTLDVMMRDYGASGFFGKTVHNRLPLTEMQEPFVALPYQNGAALLSISRDDLAAKGVLAIWLGVRLIGALALALAVYFMARADFGIGSSKPVVSAFARKAPLKGKIAGRMADQLDWLRSRWRRYHGGLGFAWLALTVCLIWIGIAATARDDIKRATKLGTSVTFTLWPIGQDSKPVLIPWDQLSLSGQYPARYMQNRISLIEDGKNGHYLLAPRIAAVTDGCRITIELAVIHLAKDASAVSVRIVERQILSTDEENCVKHFESFPAQMSIIPFRHPKASKNGATPISVLVVHAEHQIYNTFIPDIGALKEPVLYLNRND